MYMSFAKVSFQFILNLMYMSMYMYVDTMIKSWTIQGVQVVGMEGQWRKVVFRLTSMCSANLLVLGDDAVNLGRGGYSVSEYY